MIGQVLIGTTEVFQIEAFTRDNGEFACVGRLMVYASKVARNPIRPFRIKIEDQPPFTIYGILLKCTSQVLEIKEIQNETKNQS